MVDYKTDRVREGEEDILIRRYRAQMESYQQALEKITGKCVKEIYIYSVTLQKQFPCMYEISDLSYSKNRK